MRILVTVAFVAGSLGAHAVSAQTISEVTVSEFDSLYNEFYAEELFRIMNKTSEEEGAQ